MFSSESSSASDEACYACGVIFPYSQREQLQRDLAAASYDITLAANYADSVCRNVCYSPEFLRQQLEGQLETTYSLENLRRGRADFNLTSLGNMAYLALNAPSPYGGIARIAYWRLIEVFSDGKIKNEEDAPESLLK